MIEGDSPYNKRKVASHPSRRVICTHKKLSSEKHKRKSKSVKRPPEHRKTTVPKPNKRPPKILEVVCENCFRTKYRVTMHPLRASKSYSSRKSGSFKDPGNEYDLRGSGDPVPILRPPSCIRTSDQKKRVCFAKDTKTRRKPSAKASKTLSLRTKGHRHRKRITAKKKASSRASSAHVKESLKKLANLYHNMFSDKASKKRHYPVRRMSLDATDAKSMRGDAENQTDTADWKTIETEFADLENEQECTGRLSFSAEDTTSMVVQYRHAEVTFEEVEEQPEIREEYAPDQSAKPEKERVPSNIKIKPNERSKEKVPKSKERITSGEEEALEQKQITNELKSDRRKSIAVLKKASHKSSEALKNELVSMFENMLLASQSPVDPVKQPRKIPSSPNEKSATRVPSQSIQSEPTISTSKTSQSKKKPVLLQDNIKPSPMFAETAPKLKDVEKGDRFITKSVEDHSNRADLRAASGDQNTVEGIEEKHIKMRAPALLYDENEEPIVEPAKVEDKVKVVEVEQDESVPNKRYINSGLRRLKSNESRLYLDYELQPVKKKVPVKPDTLGPEPLLQEIPSEEILRMHRGKLSKRGSRPDLWEDLGETEDIQAFEEDDDMLKKLQEHEEVSYVIDAPEEEPEQILLPKDEIKCTCVTKPRTRSKSTRSEDRTSKGSRKTMTPEFKSHDTCVCSSGSKNDPTSSKSESRSRASSREKAKCVPVGKYTSNKKSKDKKRKSAHQKKSGNLLKSEDSHISLSKSRAREDFTYTYQPSCGGKKHIIWVDVSAFYKRIKK